MTKNKSFLKFVPETVLGHWPTEPPLKADRSRAEPITVEATFEHTIVMDPSEVDFNGTYTFEQKLDDGTVLHFLGIRPEKREDGAAVFHLKTTYQKEI